MKKQTIISAVLFIVVLSGYLYTITPTLPFWDCGEFISCSYTLGVPHPPGTPLMVLLGNLFTKIFFFLEEVALRVNLFAALSGAMAAVFIFLISMKVFRRINSEPSKSEMLINYIVSVAAALMGSFFYSFWQSSVEAEVYTPSGLIILLVMWLSLTWWERLEESNDDKFVILIIYITVLSIGIHMLPLLALPGSLLFFIIIAWRKYFDLAVSLISFSVFFAFMYLAMTKEMLILLIIGLFLGIVSIVLIDYFVTDRKVNYKKVFTYLGIYIGLVFIAVSTYAVLIIRARHNPYINIAAPVTLRELWDVFNRKQYGPMMLLPRKTDNGIGTVPALVEQFKMYFRYYSWQFTPYFRNEIANPSAIVRILSAMFMSLVSATGLYGIFAHFKREKKTFILIFVTFILLSAGLVFYLNLKYSPSDPIAAHEPREVRERDYFYAPSFFFFMLFYAMGLRELLLSFKRKLQGKGFMGMFSVPQIVIVALIIILTFTPFFANINSDVNRRDNWIADEYAKNLLSTPRDNSIIFTNGDNDTYPLWFEQTVKDFRTLDRENRKGVMVVNLSLLNTPWYIKQMKSFGVPIGMTESQIDNIMPVRLSNGEVLLIRDLAIRSMICATSGLPSSNELLYATKDDFKRKVLDVYKADSVDIYFSVTVAESARSPYKNNAILEGLAYRITSTEEALSFPNYVDVEQTIYNIENKYSYKSILNPALLKDDNVDRIMTNYAAGYLQLGIHFAQLDSVDQSIKYFKQGRNFYTYDPMQVTMNIISMLLQSKRFEEAGKEIEMALAKETDPDKIAALEAMLAEVYMEKGEYEEATGIYNAVIEKYPNEGLGYAGLMRIYKRRNDTEAYQKALAELVMDPQKMGGVIGFLYMQKAERDILIDLLEAWLKLRPGDPQAVELLDEIKGWKVKE